MSLATRCPACSTVFRLVQDQLKVSQGWVRCGQCQEVFNALEALFELDELPAEPTVARDPLPPASGFEPTLPTGRAADRPTPSWADPQAAQPMRWADHPAPPAPPSRLAPLTPPAPAQAARPSPTTPAATETASPPAAPIAPHAVDSKSGWPSAPSAPTTQRAPFPWADSPVEPDEPSGTTASPDDNDWFAPAAAVTPAVAPSKATQQPGTGSSKPAKDFVVSRVLEMDTDGFAASFDAIEHSEIRPTEMADGALLVAPPPPPPKFVQEADRQARWQSPLVRGSLTLVALAAGAGLAGQIAWYTRDGLAERWPVTRPALLAACQTLGCTLDSPMALEHVVLETSHLAQTQQPGVLQISAELHNNASFAVRAPALELSFTSDSGQVLVRKVLPPELLGQANRTLTPDATWHVNSRIDVGDLPVAGYSLEVFYP